MNATLLLKPLLLLTLLCGTLIADDDATQSKCEKKYDRCIEKCDDKGSEEKCYDKCDDIHQKCIAASKK